MPPLAAPDTLLSVVRRRRSWVCTCYQFSYQYRSLTTLLNHTAEHFIDNRPLPENENIYESVTVR